MNKRNNVRANLQTQVVMTGVGREGMPFQVVGHSTDISRTGYGILLDPKIISFECPIGSEVFLSSTHKFQSRAVIQWVRRDQDLGCFRVGVRLVEQKMSPWFRIAASLLLCCAFLSQVSFAGSAANSGRSSGQGAGSSQAQIQTTTPDAGQQDTVRASSVGDAGGVLMGAPEKDTQGRSWLEQALIDHIDHPSGPSLAQMRIDLTKNQYVSGDTITAGVAHLYNPSKMDQPIELKTWLASSSEKPISLGNVGADGQYILSAESEQNFGPLQVLPFDRDLPAGHYEFNARMLNPVTGEALGDDINPFTFDAASDARADADIQANSGFSLSVDLQTKQSDYRIGDTVSLADGCTIANTGSFEAPIELKIWMESPSQNSGPVAIFSIGGDGSLILSPGSSMKLEPMTSFEVTRDLPAGTYQLKTRALDPVTGQIFQESVHMFTIQ